MHTAPSLSPSRHWHRPHRSWVSHAVGHPPATQVRLTGEHFEDILDQLAHRALSALKQQPQGRILVGVAGAPGSGKSTLAAAVTQRINTLSSDDEDIAALLPMDGFHYYRRELDAMPDPQEARQRRGAHWTFNAPAFVECVRRVRHAHQAGETVLAPSFNHGVGDPVENDIPITPAHRVVICEGNYVLLDVPPWDQLHVLFDDTWFVEVDLDTAMDRVFARQTGLGIAPEVSRGRIAGNDRPNGQLVNERSRDRARVLVPSSIPFRGQ